MMNRAEKILAEAGAVITNDHFVYTSGKHGSAYVNKDALYPDPRRIFQLAHMIAADFIHEEVEVVIAPAIGAVKLEMAVVDELRRLTGGDIMGGYAEQEIQSIFKTDIHHEMRYQIVDQGGGAKVIQMQAGSELVLKLPSMVIKRGYDKLVPGKRVLVVEDILTTGQSAKRTVDAVRRHGGEVVGVGAICNRGDVTAESLGVDRLESLVNVSMQMFPADECPLCLQGIPINTELGHDQV